MLQNGLLDITWRLP